MHQEFKRKHLMLTIVWDEYIACEPAGYRYSRFCEHYRGWESRLSVTTRQAHRADQKLFVDYAGDTVPVSSIGCSAGRAAPRSSWRFDSHN